MSTEYKISQIINGVEKVQFCFTINLTNPDDYEDYEWDSRTGLVTAKKKSDQKRYPIPTLGKTYGQLEPANFTATGCKQIKYNYQYY